VFQDPEAAAPRRQPRRFPVEWMEPARDREESCAQTEVVNQVPSGKPA